MLLNKIGKRLKQERLKNNLTLLIISYRDYDNIETILDAFFKKFNDQSQDVKED